MTQQQLAKALGVRRATVSDWEAGRYAPPPFLRLALRCLDEHPEERGE